MDIRKGIPKRISPDNLIDTYIEFQIVTDYNASKIEKVLIDSLTENGFIFKRIPFLSPTKEFTDKWLFTDGKVRFFIREDKIGINCVNTYIGWKNYLEYIRIILCYSSNYIDINSLELKYVSKWDDIPILDYIDGDFKLSQFPRFDGFFVSFSAIKKAHHLPDDPLAKVMIKENITIDNVKCSLIDITVNITCHQLEGFDKTETALHYLNEVHDAQKEMFFSLLKKEFIESLHPIW